MRRAGYLWALLFPVAASAAPAKPAASKPAVARPVAAARLPVATPAQNPAAVAAIQELNRGAAVSGRLSMTVTVRALTPKAVDTAAAMVEALGQAPTAQTSTERITFSPAGERREIVFSTGKKLVTTRTGGLVRSVVDGAEPGSPADCYVWPERESPGLSADRVLFLQSAALFKGVSWHAARRDGERLVLSGVRGRGKVEATIGQRPVAHLLSATVTTPPSQPGGESLTESLTAEYASQGSAPALQTIRLSIFTLGKRGQGLQTEYRIAEFAAGNGAADLRLQFPAGAQVMDSRVSPPAVYKAADKEPTLAELRALQTPAEGPGVKLNGPAPTFKLAALDGTTLNLADYRGKVVLLNWFASWCGPCQAEAPKMEREIWQKYRARGLTVIAVNAGERSDPKAKAREFAQKHSLTYPIVLDESGEVSEAYGVQAFPTNVLIDRKGNLRYIKAGFDEASILKLLETLLNEA